MPAKKKMRAGKRRDRSVAPRTESEIVAHIAQATGLTKEAVARVLEALRVLIKKDLGRRGPGVFTIPGLFIRMRVVRKPATKARKGINPFTGDEMMFKAKPARNVVKVTPLTALRSMVGEGGAGWMGVGTAEQAKDAGVAKPSVGRRPPSSGPTRRPTEKACKPYTAYPDIAPSDEHPTEGQTLTVTVSLGQEPSKTTRGRVQMETEDPKKVEEFKVQLYFAGRSAWDTLKYSPERGTEEPAEFEVVAPGLGRRPGEKRLDRQVFPLTANFYLNNRWCGEGIRSIEVRGSEAQPPVEIPPPPKEPHWRESLQLDPSAEPPDLLVRIQHDRDRPGGYFWSFASPHMDLSCVDDDCRLVFKQGAEGFVESNFGGVGDKPKRLTKTRVRGFAERIYQNTPKAFKDVYWKLYEWAAQAPDRAFETIQFITDEPHIPWELMRVTHPKRQVKADFLSIRHSVGRWVSTQSCHLIQDIQVNEMAVFATDYSGTAVRELPWAKEEKEHLIKEYNAHPYPMKFDPVVDLLEKGGVQAVHFACHGKMYTDAPDKSELILEDETESLIPSDLNTEEAREGLGQEHPLVFLNACELGATGNALSLIGGFPSAFIGMGASAFIGTLWPVNDETAHAISKQFYELAFSKGGSPLGEVMKEIRKKWETNGHLTYLAYVLYGDPKAKVLFTSRGGGDAEVHA